MYFLLLGFLDWNFPLWGVGCEKKDILKNIYFIHLFFGCSGSSLLHGLLFSSCSKWGMLFVVMGGCLIAVDSLVVESRF